MGLRSDLIPRATRRPASTAVDAAALALALTLAPGCVRAPSGPPSAPSSASQPGPAPAPSYTVSGHTYAPLATWRGYHEEGVASYYGDGDGLDGGTTASGERLDSRALTAAHRTLPLGSCVEVENLRTGARTVVRVNDRGPFAGGRLIDLSSAAARAIGIAPTAGTGRVRLEAIGSADGPGACPDSGPGDDAPPDAAEPGLLDGIGAWFRDLF